MEFDLGVEFFVSSWWRSSLAKLVPPPLELDSEVSMQRRENRVTWHLDRAVVEQLDTVDGDKTIEQALANAGIMKARQRSPTAIG
ncbi:hypothetical protein AUR04nite_34370 [Glutamicibacter uratoxydans]|uniref:Uncharacterized protein n=2 Tax=Glutamicibacter uratoxydans TaxID=43667 RepID=A0A4Y4DWC3_GLUUR|nr:hypothetical protein [Glutamicibacter uratoxydans]GED07905.1 hypothetical protein AUR04nite_34370 [Glutamicibacter uratoxydans]